MSYVITTLGGRRWPLWNRMLASVRQEWEGDGCETHFAWVWDPSDLESIHELAYGNTQAAVRHAGSGGKGPTTPVHISTEMLLTWAARDAVPILHLEDDWECRRDEQPGWLELALSIFEKHQGIGQVRLRSVREYLERGNTLTKDRVQWLVRDGYRVSVGATQCNFPPALWNPAAVKDTFPAGSEREAGMNFARAGWRIAQLWPGVFYHTGKDCSLIPGHTPERHERSIENHRVPEEEI